MAKKEKPLFTNLISGTPAFSGQPVAIDETTQQMVPEERTDPGQAESSEKQKEPAGDEAPSAPRQSKPSASKQEHKGPEGKLYIKGVPVKPVIVHLPQEVAEKTKAIAVMEGTTMREVITQAMSLCIQRYEKKHGGIRPLQHKAEHIFE